VPPTFILCPYSVQNSSWTSHLPLQWVKLYRPGCEVNHSSL
jgi:hypothetical protein